MSETKLLDYPPLIWDTIQLNEDITLPIDWEENFHEVWTWIGEHFETYALEEGEINILQAHLQEIYDNTAQSVLHLVNSPYLNPLAQSQETLLIEKPFHDIGHIKRVTIAAMMLTDAEWIIQEYLEQKHNIKNQIKEEAIQIFLQYEYDLRIKYRNMIGEGMLIHDLGNIYAREGHEERSIREYIRVLFPHARTSTLPSTPGLQNKKIAYITNLVLGTQVHYPTGIQLTNNPESSSYTIGGQLGAAADIINMGAELDIFLRKFFLISKELEIKDPYSKANIEFVGNIIRQNTYPSLYILKNGLIKERKEKNFRVLTATDQSELRRYGKQFGY